jgi:apolipoprotein N-acyltransferase
MALAFSPFDVWMMAPIAIALLSLALVVGTASASSRRCLGLGVAAGAAFGLTFFAALAPWLQVIGPDAYALVVLVSLLFTAMFGGGAAFVVRLPGWPLWIACWWVAVEAVRSRFPFGGFPWGRIGHSQIDAPTAAWVSVGGVPLLSLLVVLLGALAAWVVISLVRRGTAAAFVGAAGCVAIGASGLAIATPTAGDTVTVAVIQGSVPDTGMDAFGRREAVLNAHLDGTHQLAEDVRTGAVAAPNIVIWPENASDIDPSLDAGAFDRISTAVADIGVPVLVGVVVEVDGGERVANQGTVWSPDTGPGQTYVKQHLVPFGEYVPFRGVLERFISRLDRIPRDFVAGTNPGVLDIGPMTVADVICFDVAYDAAVRDAVAGGGEVITVQTNNATYGRTAQVEQQWAVSRLRAIEHGRTVVVASTSGISGVITPDGSVVTRAPEFEPAVIVEAVPARTELTFATRLGAWPELVISLIGLVALGAAVSKASRGRGKIEA